MTAKGPKVVRVEINEADPPGDPCESSAVIDVFIEDGRRFSILAATPAWFTKAMRELGLRNFFGPSVLFLRSIDLSVAKKALDEMTEDNDRLLCRHDTPRMTLRKVLEDFKARVLIPPL